MTSYLFTMWDGGGLVPPELAVARRLRARGHDVRVLADPTCEDEIRGAGCEFSAWRTAPHRTSRAREHDLLRDYEAKSPIEMVRNFMRDFLAEPASRWVADTCAVLDAHPADVLVTDFTLPAPLIAGEARGLGTAVLVPNIWMVPTPGIPPIGPGFMPARGPLGRARDALLRAVYGRIFDRARPALDRARAEVGLGPIASTHEQMVRADRVLVLTSPRFDWLSPAMPPQVRYTGPELDEPQWCEPWRSPWPATDPRPLVLVSLSSTYQAQVPALRNIVAALSQLEVRALVTLGLVVRPDEVRGSDNVIVVPSAPHGPILREAAALVTHCGHGTTMKGLAAGVPLVCLPMGRDQNDTAARVVHAGAGVRLKPTASVKAIRRAVSRVLDEPTFRAGAERMRKLLVDRDGCADAVAELEAVGGQGSSAQRSAPSRTSASSSARAPSSAT